MTFQHLLYTFVTALATLFPVINPFGSGFVINGFLSGLSDEERKSAVKKIVINCLLIALGSLILGHLIILLFDLSIPVIQIGGGIVICTTAWGWLSDSKSPDDVDPDKIPKITYKNIEQKLFYPIAFPITVGAGGISVIFTLMASTAVKGNIVHTVINYSMICLAIVAILAMLYVFISQGPRITKRLGESGNLILNKLVAFIMFCVGIQILIKGIGTAFHLTIL